MARPKKTPDAPPRQPSGSLEAEVMVVLWDADDALTAAEVLAELSRPLAYTTVMTILTRLQAKGVVSRAPAGRAYAYRPVEGRAEMAAKRMAEVLERNGDRSAVLSQFVTHLSPSEVAALKAAARSGARRS